MKQLFVKKNLNVKGQSQKVALSLVMMLLNITKFSNRFIIKTVFYCLFLISYCLISDNVYGQQDAMYTQYMFDKMLVNPAYTGSSSWVVGTLKYRNQFMGLEGAPVTQTFTFHGPIQTKHIGLGLKVIHDKAAVENTLTATGSFAYHLGFSGGKLSFGLEGGILNRSIDFANLIRKDNTDNAIPLAKANSIVPDASFGVYYQKKDFYTGASIYHLVKSKMDYNNYSRNDVAHLYKHSFFLIGYVFDLNKNFSLETSSLVKYVQAAPIQFDFNTNVIYKDKITMGTSYRTGDAVSFLFRVNITDELRVVYSCDYTLSTLSKYSNGSHELLVSYGIKLLPPPAEKEIHPRYYF